MNYLAHLFLAKRNALSLTGNMMGDFKRHANHMVLPQEIVKGIANHRFVDKCTDSHPGVKSLRTVFSPVRRRFTGIISDIAFDYYLVKHWSKFTDESFDGFVNFTYKALLESHNFMPERMQTAVTSMTRNDWLRGNAKLENIGYAIDRMSSRIRFENNLAGGLEEITENYDQVELVFLDLFPYLQRMVKTQGIEDSRIIVASQ